MAINASTNLIAVQTNNALKLLDPKTSALLLTIEIDIKLVCFTQCNILICTSKNMLYCYDYKGLEIWKQHMGGDSSIVYMFYYQNIFGFVYANKEIRFYTQISEQKVILDIITKEIVKVYQHNQYLAIVDDIQNQVYLFLLDDLFLQKGKPFKQFITNTTSINDLCLNNVLATISNDKQLTIFDLATTQIILQTVLESEPLCITQDIDYVFVGCVNKNIYQIKYNNHSINYTIQPTTQIKKKKVLIGHLTEVKSVNLFFEDGHINIISNSNDGQIYIWNVDTNNPTLLKKTLTLQAQQLFVIQRPIEYQQQSEEQILFKNKRILTLKPLKKANYTNGQQVLLKKQIQKIKLSYTPTQQILTNNIPTVDINSLIEENQKLKKLLHLLSN